MTGRILDDMSSLITLGARSLGCTPDLARAIRNVLSCADDFFRTPDDSYKMAHHTDIGEGYRPFATEYTDSPDHPDLVEWFSCSVSRNSVEKTFPQGSGLRLYRSLLGAQPLFAEVVENLTVEVFHKAGIEIPSTRFLFDFLGWSRLQVNYGVNSRTERDLLVVPHEDGNFLTLVYSTQPGLELLSNEGTEELWWGSGDKIAVLAGEILTAATAGAVATGFHQVRRLNAVERRLSLIYFADPDPFLLELSGAPVLALDAFNLITNGWLRSGVPPVRTSLSSLNSQASQRV